MSEPDKPGAAAILHEFLAFLRRPQVLIPSGLRAPGAGRRWLVVVALQVVGLALLLPLLQLWQKSFSLPAPDAFGGIPAVWLPVIVVGAAPLLEELLFRGWQSGRPRALWLLVCALVTAGALLTAMHGGAPLAAAIAVLLALLAAPIGWFGLRRKPTSARFAAAFRPIFYLGVAAFALPHLFNYPQISLLALPMVLPQAWAGLTLGYLRQRIGLIAAILAHAASNGLALGVAMLASG